MHGEEHSARGGWQSVWVQVGRRPVGHREGSAPKQLDLLVWRSGEKLGPETKLLWGSTGDLRVWPSSPRECERRTGGP